MPSNEADTHEEQRAGAPSTTSMSTVNKDEEGKNDVVVRETPSRGGISSELDALPEDEDMLSTNLHKRQTMHYRGDGDDDDDLDLHDSFATGDIIQCFRPQDQAKPSASKTTHVPGGPQGGTMVHQQEQSCP